MKLIIKQKILSFFASYNVYDENDNVVYTIKGQPSWGNKFIITNAEGQELGCINQKIFSLLPCYEIFKEGKQIGKINRKFSMFKPKYECDLGGYTVDGDFFAYKYQVKKDGKDVASISKKVFAFKDTYVIDTTEEDAFNALLIVIAIDTDKAMQERNNRR